MRPWAAFLALPAAGRWLSPGKTMSPCRLRRCMAVSSSRESMRVTIGQVAVIGGGAVGSLFAGRLASLRDLKERVWLLTNWEQHASAVRQTQGVIVLGDGSPGGQGSSLVGGVRVSDKAGEILRAGRADDEKDMGHVNVVFLACKQPQVRKAAEDAAKLLAGAHGGLLITLLNGVGHMDILHKALRYHDVNASLIHGVYHGGAAIECPGVVRHTGSGKTDLGTPREGLDELSEQLLADVAAALTRAGLPAAVRGDVDSAVWEKLAVNAAINPLAAILGVPNGALLDSPSARDIMTEAAYEAQAVGSAVLRARLGDDAAEKTPFVANGVVGCADRAVAVATATAQNSGSMLRDVRRGVVTEIESISGGVVREGSRHGIETPVNRVLLGILRAMNDVHGPGAGQKGDDDEEGG